MSELDLSKYDGHTDGVWRLDIGTGRVVSLRGDRCSEVARMRPTCVTDQWESDASLIADAPLLLAEVKQLRAARQAWAIRAAEESARVDALLEAAEKMLDASEDHLIDAWLLLRESVEAAKVKHGE